MAPGSVSSLDDSSASSDDGADYEEEELRIAEQEWEENLRQLHLLVSVVLLPYVGKWLGRRWAHTIYGRYCQVGWSWELFFGGRK